MFMNRQYALHEAKNIMYGSVSTVILCPDISYTKPKSMFD